MLTRIFSFDDESIPIAIFEIFDTR